MCICLSVIGLANVGSHTFIFNGVKPINSYVDPFVLLEQFLLSTNSCRIKEKVPIRPLSYHCCRNGIGVSGIKFMHNIVQNIIGVRGNDHSTRTLLLLPMDKRIRYTRYFAINACIHGDECGRIQACSFFRKSEHPRVEMMCPHGCICPVLQVYE